MFTTRDLIYSQVQHHRRCRFPKLTAPIISQLITITCFNVIRVQPYYPNMISPSTYPPQIHSYSTNVTTSLSTSERPNASRCGQCELSKDNSRTYGIDYPQISRFFQKSLMLKTQSCHAIPLLLPDSCVIPGFLRFKANWLIEISVQSVVSHTPHINGLFFHLKRLLFTNHKVCVFECSMMIRNAAQLRILLFWK